MAYREQLYTRPAWKLHAVARLKDSRPLPLAGSKDTAADVMIGRTRSGNAVPRVDVRQERSPVVAVINASTVAARR